MNSEQKFWICVWSLIAAILINLTICITAYYTITAVKAIGVGYVESQAIGTCGSYWTTPDKARP